MPKVRVLKPSILIGVPVGETTYIDDNEYRLLAHRGAVELVKPAARKKAEA